MTVSGTSDSGCRQACPSLVILVATDPRAVSLLCALWPPPWPEIEPGLTR